MKFKWLLLPAISLTLLACDRPQKQSETNPSGEETEKTNDNTADNSNTAEDSNLKTSSEGADDQTINQKVLNALAADDKLSLAAKNIEITTVDGVVTLRGKVKNNQRSELIEKKIATISGVRGVDNKLEIARRY